MHFLVDHAWAAFVITFGAVLTIILLIAVLIRLKWTNVRLAAAHRESQTYLDVTGTLLACLDAQGRVTMMNWAARRTLKIPESEDVLGEDWFARFVPPEHSGELRRDFESFLESSANEAMLEYEVMAADGESRLIQWHRTRVLGVDVAGGAVILSSGEDVTERRAIEERLRFESFLLGAVNDSIIIHDGEGRILYANDAAARIRGFTHDELISRDFRTLVAPEYISSMIMHREILERDGNAVYETGHLDANGRTIVLEVHSRLIDYQGQRAILSVGRDVSERVAAAAEIRRLAHYDPVTGLPNRTLFGDRLAMALAAAERHEERVALLFLDLDHFKEVNDVYGHSSGDDLLRQVAERLVSCVRSEDTVSRFGGDEFTVLLVGLKDPGGAERVAHDILKALRRPFTIDGTSLPVSASIGVSTYRPGTTTAVRMLAEADAAMYKAKNGGRDRVHLSTSSED